MGELSEDVEGEGSYGPCWGITSCQRASSSRASFHSKRRTRPTVLLPVTVVNLALRNQSHALVLALSNLKEAWRGSWFSLFFESPLLLGRHLRTQLSLVTPLLPLWLLWLDTSIVLHLSL